MKNADKKQLITNLNVVWPDAKLGRTSNDDLLWLVEIAGLLHADGGARTMSATMQKYRESYVPTTAYSGRKSLSNGDVVADFLAGMEPNEVLRHAEQILGLEVGELVARYAHLNPGAQRMNGGNLLRGALKRKDITAEDLLIH